MFSIVKKVIKSLDTISLVFISFLFGLSSTKLDFFVFIYTGTYESCIFLDYYYLYEVGYTIELEIIIFLYDCHVVQ